MRRNSTLLGTWALLISLILLAGACSNTFTQEASGDFSGAEEGQIPVVEAVQARFGSLPLSERLNGTVIAENQVVLYPELSAKIARVMVRDGNYVERGDPLVYLEDRQYREQLQQAEATYRVNQAALKQAQARYQELEAQYKRTQMLAEEGLSSQLELDTLEAQMSAAEASIELARAQIQQAQSAIQESKEVLSRMVIRAPITGTVGQRNAEVGMQVNTSTQLFTIGNLKELKVQVVLTENMLQNVSTGQSARVHVRAQSQQPVTVEGRVARISPFLDPVTRSTEAEIELSTFDSRLRPGMYVPVDILYGESRQATLVPTSSVYANPNTGEEGVYVAPELASEAPPRSNDSDSLSSTSPPTEIQFRPVQVLAEGRMEVGIVGVEPGTWVVTVGQNLLTGGVKKARVRTTTWEHIQTLQGLQRQDLLEQVLGEQGEVQ